MRDHVLDLGAYAARTGFDDRWRPTLSTLAGIVRCHTSSIPFENLDPLLGRPVPLDLPSLEAKLVRQGRGGYCFEQNALLRAALDEIGFRTTGLGARVVWGAEAGAAAITARTHMLVRVDLDEGTYLVDVGFGGQTPTAPLRLELDLVQATPHGRYRLTDGPDGDLVLEAEVAGEWRAMYRFDLRPQHAVDYEVANHYVATHPSSPFRNSLLAARATPEGRWALRGRELSYYGLDGAVKQRRVESPADLRDVLVHDLLVRLPADLDLEEVFARAG